jgi:hypothetical protein
MIIKDNIDKNNNKLLNSRAINFLFFGFLNSFEDKSTFDFLP